MFIRILPLLLPFLCLSLHCTSVQAQDLKQLDRRLKALEKKVANSLTESEESDRNVKSFLNTKINLGGFFESGFTAIGENDKSFQLSAGSDTLGINLGAEFSDQLRFSAQFISFISLPLRNPQSDPRGNSVGLPSRAEFRDYTLTTLVTQGYLEWGNGEAFNIQGGMGYVPFGITFQQLELVLLVRRGGPQLLQDSALVFPLWQGVHIHGQFSLKKSRWGYSVYTFSDSSNPKFPGTGERLWWQNADDTLGLGLSSQNTKRTNNNNSTTLGADLRFKYRALTLTSEFAERYGAGSQPWSFYIEPDLDVYHQSILLYIFADYLVSPLNRTGTGALSLEDPFKKWQFGTGVNWLPTSYTRLRFGITFNNYVESNLSTEDRNYVAFDLSAGVAF